MKAAYQQCPEFTIQTSTTQDSLVCLNRKQLFNIWTMRTATYKR